MRERVRVECAWLLSLGAGPAAHALAGLPADARRWCEALAADPGATDVDAIKTIEARLAKDPSDLRGWQVIAGAYAQVGRYADAVDALRKVNQLTTPTADSLTDLGEALMMRNGGSVAGEPLDLFKQAAALDPKHVRSRFYIAGHSAGAYTVASDEWANYHNFRANFPAAFGTLIDSYQNEGTSPLGETYTRRVSVYTASGAGTPFRRACDPLHRPRALCRLGCRHPLQYLQNLHANSDQGNDSHRL